MTVVNYYTRESVFRPWACYIPLRAYNNISETAESAAGVRTAQNQMHTHTYARDPNIGNASARARARERERTLCTRRIFIVRRVEYIFLNLTFGRAVKRRERERKTRI